MPGPATHRAVVAGVDGSEDALRAAHWAAAEAARRNAPLRLVSAFDWTPDLMLGHAGLRDTYREMLLERTEVQLGAAAATVQNEFPGVEVDQQLLVGPPSRVLIREAERAQLLVLGDRGLTRLEGLLVGSVAVAVATHAVCPTVVVRGAERSPMDDALLPVVAGVDTSMPDDAVLGFAFEAAAVRRVPLVAVHTWWDVDIHPYLLRLIWDEVEFREQRLLAQRVAGWAEKYPGVPVEQVVVCSRPAHVLLERTRQAQLVVVGSRGRGELAGLLLGSVSNALVHRAACPVAVVPSVAQHGPQMI